MEEFRCVSQKQMKNRHVAEVYLTGKKRKTTLGFVGKLIRVHPQTVRQQAQTLWTLERAKVGTGAWWFFTVDACCTASFKRNITKVHERLILRRCEINGYSACVQPVNHPWSIWDLRGKKEESAASLSVDPQIPMAGVAEWPRSVDCTQGFVGLYHMTGTHMSPHGNEHVTHMYSCRKWGQL